MINGIKKETIVSTTEDRLTLLNWLKKLEKTLSDDTLTDIAFNDDNGNVSLALTFEDGTTKSVAFPYDMSKFAKKSEIDKVLEDRGTLDLRDNTKFDVVEEQTTANFYLKVNLENGIYHLDISSLSDQIDNFINFGTLSETGDNKLNYKYVQIINPLSRGDSLAYNPSNGYCNGLGSTRGYVLLSQELKSYDYVIIINNGIVTCTVSEEQ